MKNKGRTGEKRRTAEEAAGATYGAKRDASQERGEACKRTITCYQNSRGASRTSAGTKEAMGKVRAAEPRARIRRDMGGRQTRKGKDGT